jgi:hypothetical protein
MHDHEFKLDMDGQVTCSICGAMGDDMPNPQPELNQSGYGYDELKDFDMGYKDSRKNRITPFLGRSR